MIKRIAPEQAAQMLLQLPVDYKTEYVSLPDSLNRILAEDVYSVFPLPPFEKSSFDGFAFRSCDVPGTLPIEGYLPAGVQNLSPLKPGYASRIFTGAPLPPGADAVVRFEEVTDNGNSVIIDKAFKPNSNVIAVGEDCAKGICLAEKGVRLSAAHVGMLASQGMGRVLVYRRPKAVVIATGSELAIPGSPRPAYGIYDCNTYTLSSYLKALGFDVISEGIVEDNPRHISDVVRKAMDSDADIVLTTGGASVGDFDYALATANTIGADVLFWKVRMKPGGALLAAVRNNKALLSLSGNPGAALTSLMTVLLPYIQKLTGVNSELKIVKLPIRSPMPKSAHNMRFLRGHLIIENGQAWFEENIGQGNGMLSSFVNFTAIGVVPPHVGPLNSGDEIEILILPRCIY